MPPDFARLGNENAFAVLARVAALREQGRDIVNLGIGQPDMPTPPHIVEAAVRALRDGRHGYTDSAGIAPLREAVAGDLHRRYGVEVRPDRVLVVPGAKMTMFAAVLMVGAPGVEIVYPDPGFPIYRSLIEFTGATPVAVPVGQAGVSAERILALLTDRTRLLILNSPGNPTGSVTPQREIDPLVAGLAAHPQVAVLSDEIYGAMTYDGVRHHSLLAYPELRDRLIHLDGASKTYAMTGWRLGWAVWPDGLYDAARRFAVNSFSCVNSAAQWAGVAALEGPQDCVRDMVAEFDSRRRVLVAGLRGLPGVSCATPTGAFYAFPDISGTGRPAGRLAAELLERAGVAAIDGGDFGRHGEGHLRLSYASSLPSIERAVERMAAYLGDL